MSMKWQNIYTNVAGKRRLQCRVALKNLYEYKIVARGGFTMVKHWWLAVSKGFNSEPFFRACFFSLKDAKDAAEALATGQRVEVSLVNLAGIYS